MNIKPSIPVFASAKLLSLLCACFGFMLGVLYGIGGAVIDALVSLKVLSPITFETPGLSIGTLMALMALVVMPSLAAVVGFCFGIVSSFLYNLLSHLMALPTISISIERGLNDAS